MNDAESTENNYGDVWLCHKCSLDALCRLLDTDTSGTCYADLSKWVKRRKG